MPTLATLTTWFEACEAYPILFNHIPSILWRHEEEFLTTSYLVIMIRQRTWVGPDWIVPQGGLLLST